MIMPKGGTEMLHATLLQQLNNEELNGINLILNEIAPSLIESNKLNILWNHHSYNQPAIQAYQNKDLFNRIDYTVYVSHWQYEKYRYIFQIPENRSIVIRNAILPMELKTKPKKIKLIYTSTPWRGLDVLLDAFALLNRDDVELDVYSSTIIYGTEFHQSNEHHYAELFKRAQNMSNVNYHGYASNDEVRDALLNSHIFAYPCTWEETSCLSAIEAGMAGLSIVTTNLGALYETVNTWGKLVIYETNKMNLAKKFASALNKAIDDYWIAETQAKLEMQHVHFKEHYSWSARILDWKSFLSQVKI
jgi:glycosyltransferase involved in cell wall biosynthesis